MNTFKENATINDPEDAAGTGYVPQIRKIGDTMYATVAHLSDVKSATDRLEADIETRREILRTHGRDKPFEREVLAWMHVKITEATFEEILVQRPKLVRQEAYNMMKNLHTQIRSDLEEVQQQISNSSDSLLLIVMSGKANVLKTELSMAQNLMESWCKTWDLDDNNEHN
jgi:hypothetical protein